MGETQSRMGRTQSRMEPKRYGIEPKQSRMEPKEPKKLNILLVAAIDFGTTFSSWAYSFKHSYEKDWTNVYTKTWYGNGISHKAPTAVLIGPDRETFDSFGYNAEDKYAELLGKNKHKAWYYFRRFKMILYEKKKLEKNMKLKDETGKSLPAMKVFSLVIRYLREDFLKVPNTQLAVGTLLEEEIMWVLTVPAIWDDAAKQFMREAAIMAGIKESNFTIALEAEVASLYCSRLPVDKMVQGGGISSFKTGSKYMVLDAGGGTIDITVHEVMPGFKLKEIHKANGGFWGGTKVDEAFEQFLIALVGTEVFSRFKTEQIEDYVILFRDFEVKKLNVSPDSDNPVRLHFPSSLKGLFFEVNGEEISKAIAKPVYVNKISLSGDKLVIEEDAMKGFFSETIKNIVSHVKDLMKDTKVKEISSILMVGGFSESKMLQHAIKFNFDNVKVIIPQEAGLVVLKGAVIFGHSPFSIAERVCKFTYGTNASVPYDKIVHYATEPVEHSDGLRCNVIFSTLVEAGQTVKYNEMTEEMSFIPVDEDQTYMKFDIYASPGKPPMYFTDKGCVKMDTKTIPICDMSVPRDERKFLVSMCFGGTEIEVTVKEKQTGETYKLRMNCLE